MYALVEVKGKQYKAEKGRTIAVDLFDNKPGDKVEFDKVLMVSGDKETKVGSPYVKGAKVTAVIEESFRGKKVIVYKYKRRKGFKKKQGHRQNYTTIKVEDIIGA